MTEAERLLFRKLPYPGLYHCVARYGYGDQVQMGVPFVTRLLDKVTTCSALVCSNAKQARLCFDMLCMLAYHSPMHEHAWFPPAAVCCAMLIH